LVILQPVNAYFRPHLDKTNPNIKTKTRLMWEYLHKFLGYGMVVTAWYNIIYALSTMVTTNTGLKIFWWISFGFSLTVYSLLFIWSICNTKTEETTLPTSNASYQALQNTED